LTKKVLHVIARMNLGGTARYVGALVENIPNSNLATGYVQGLEIEEGSVQHYIDFRIPHLGRRISLIEDYKSWIALKKIIKEVRPEIVHTHTFKAGLIGRLIGGNHKRVHTFHGHLFEDISFTRFQKIVIVCVERFLATRTDVLISVGEKVGQDLRSAGIGRNRNWVSIVPGVNPPKLMERERARSTLGVSYGGFLVGWMARMAEVKNPFLLLQVAARLPDIRFVMAGGGNLFEDIKRNAPKNVAVIGWSDAAIFWSAVDCAISTSDNEGVPIALIEAQLAGIPVIATNVGSNGEIVLDGETGFLVRKNASELIDSVQKLEKSAILLRSMGDLARNRTSKKFSLSTMIAEHIKIYSQL